MRFNSILGTINEMFTTNSNGKIRSESFFRYNYLTYEFDFYIRTDEYKKFSNFSRQQQQQNTRWQQPPQQQIRPRDADFSQNWQEQTKPDPQLEAELFSGMNSGINFDKYEEIPVEATGKECPSPISHVSRFIMRLKSVFSLPI
jgi:hypothetical protein